MGEKFCLKWNDFQSTVSSSFKTLRQEEDFFDVTLVSDDEVQMSAHKLILSACSSFFKSILRKNPHQHPLIYLSGVNSANLAYILDYIYQGEVMLYQNNLDQFLDMAQKLKISGLNQELSDEKTGKDFENDYFSPSINDQNSQMDYYSPSSRQNKEVGKVEGVDLPIVASKRQYSRATEPIKAVAVTTENFDLKEAVNNLISKENNFDFVCKACGKRDSRIQNMNKHVEIHIEGLTYGCHSCDKTFRSKSSYNNHMYRDKTHKMFQE